MPTFGANPLGTYASSVYTAAVSHCKFTSPNEIGTITTMHARVSSAIANSFRFSIYANSLGNPGALLASSASAISVDGDDVATWEQGPVSYLFAPNTIYHLALWFANSNGRFYHTIGTTNQHGYDFSGTFPTWPNPSGGGGSNAFEVGIYATYSPAAIAVINPSYRLFPKFRLRR